MVLPLWHALFAQGEGLWAMARPSTKTATFTSHSERVGTWVLDTRVALAQALDHTFSDTTAAALLQCVDDLVAHTHASPLHNTHADVLRAPVERWCPVPATTVAAYRVLTRWPPKSPDAMPHLLALLRSAAPQESEQAWRVAAEWAPEASGPAWLDQLDSDAVHASPERRAGAAYMLGRMLAQPRGNSARRLCDLVLRLSGDTKEVVLWEVARLWPEYVQVQGADDLCPCVAVLDALRQASMPVRAECARAVGVWVERQGQPGPPALQAWMTEHLWGKDGLVHDADAVTRSHAMWALANWCAVADVFCWDRQQVALRALQDDERVAVHAVRAVGSLGRRAPPAEVERILREVQALVARDRAPKVRWNATAGVSRVLEREDATPPGAWAIGVQCMTVALDDPLFKVKRIALQALVHVTPTVWATLPVATREAARAAVERVQTQLDEAVQHATFAEAQLHARACITLAQQLSATWTTW